MKRVLNSGHIKLLLSLGSEAQIFNRFKCGFPDLSNDDFIEVLYKNKKYAFSQVLLKFEIKAPVSLLRIWHQSNVGTVNEYGQFHIDEGYIPPFFYKKDSEGFTQLDPKDCNDLFTKFNNYYTASVNFYHKLLERGLCKEQAQLILPTGLFVTFQWMVDAKDLISFIEKNNSISPEMYGYCETFMIYLNETLPRIMEWIQKNQPII